ncbi:hypothetical protein [Aeromicrobium sp. Root495]|uniref:hypothetical protein n=1 Tax=Aeromicrobium sp. Root495 TaxID=1736550 RepID=UPI000A4E7210|nr:hypothetical protein [Aeromicrobium sp. Root495]
MPRRRPRPRPERGGRPEPRQSPDVVEEHGGRAWFVRRLTGSSSAKTYTCPACHRPIPPGTAHVVAWPVEKALLSEDAAEERRHWHHDCWRRLR